MRLRPATEADRDFFLRVRREAFRELVETTYGCWDEDVQRERSNGAFDRGPIQIVEKDDGPVGYLSVRREPDHDFLSGVALLASAQRRGLGTAVVLSVVEDARCRGVPLGLSVYLANPARRLYERLGFRLLRIEPPRVFMEWQAG